MFGKSFTNLHLVRKMQHLELYQNYFDKCFEVFNKLKPLKTSQIFLYNLKYT